LRLGQIGDAKNVRAALHEQRRDLFQSVAVCVRLDDGDDFHARADTMTNPGEIPAQRGEIDFSPATVHSHAART
jgi:hypothetical protein